MKSRKTYPIDQCPLYRLQSRKKLAKDVFNLELSHLESLAKNTSNYRIFKIPSGDKERQVEVPKPILERIHRRLFALLERIHKPPYLQSGVKGRSYITNAQLHVGLAPLVKLDVKKFYPSIDSARVYRFFNTILLCSPDVSGLLTKLTTCEGHVPTGSCVSQLLAFFAAKPMFDELDYLATKQSLRFSCYVDDMTFSGTLATPSLLWAAKQIVHSHGFGYHKDRCYTAEQDKLVTGVMVTSDRIAILPSREFELWRKTQDLGTGDIEQRIAAVNSLIGTVVAASQIEARLLSRLKRLKGIKAAFEQEASTSSPSQR
ncbi:MAG: reverse transcriptase family protein [Gammaproteobacteria bacterium]|nr:reverse transcriptase family protein [Gammaproteobacteria bacterium]MBU1481098.1 reverse transcriptase family protein [Gammaproteobacteria bacterium]